MFELRELIKIIIVVLLNHFVTNGYTILQGDHICQRQENFTEIEHTKSIEPVQVRKNSWCLEIPPRCSNYETELRETMKKENITKTRTIDYCCDGYAEVTDKNVTTCAPICKGGCMNGTCESPNTCKCEIGYMGKHCNFRCKQGFWGEDCKHLCKCSNNSQCDSQTGECRCPDGFIGKSCENKCPEGFHGASCKKPCQCNGGKCHHKNGDCLLNITHIIPNNPPKTNDKIKAKQSSNLYQNKTKTDNDTSYNSTTVRTIIKPMLIHPYMNSTESSYASSFKNYMGKLNLTKKTHGDFMENPMEDPLIFDGEIDPELEDIPEEDEVETVYLDSKGEAIGYLSPVLAPTGPKPSSKPGVIGVLTNWEIDHNHIIHNLTDHPEQSHSIDHPYHHDSDKSIAMVTVSCLLLSLLILVMLALYLRRVNRRLVEDQPIEHHHTDFKKSDHPEHTAIKIISEPLPHPPRSILTKQKSVTFEDIVIAQEANSPITKIEHYDIPGNNGFVSADLYAVPMKLKPLELPEIPSGKMSANDNKFNTLPKKTARKLSIEHIYDEIEYPLRVDHVKYI